MEEIDPTDSNRAERVAMIGVAEAKESALRGATTLLPVLERLLECDLDRGRSVVRVEDTSEPARRDLDQRGRESDARFVAEPEKCRVRDALELVAKCTVESRMAMPVYCAPAGAAAFSLSPPLGVVSYAAFAARDPVGRPLRHLRERMPGNSLVQLF